jgi:hypothetical protein
MDAPCLERLAAMKLAAREQSRFVLTNEGRKRHATEVLKVRTAGP